ncbi:MAG: R3H domain-containing nucleic acid-binding protein [bacterium]|nr:hypothetical protein [Candidatus Sumerlaeota bacterium]
MTEITVSGNTFEEALTGGLKQLGVDQDLVDIEELSHAHEDVLPGAEPLPGVTLRLTVKTSLITSRAKDHLKHVLKLMGINAQIETLTRPHGTILNILAGDDGALIIGRNGQNLEALHHLIIRMTVGGCSRDTVLLHIDSECYREKQISRLEQMARHAADRVRRTKRECALKPMPPADRRLIHMLLKNVSGVHTISRGEESQRYVVVTPEMGEYGGGHRGQLKPKHGYSWRHTEGAPQKDASSSRDGAPPSPSETPDTSS